MLYMELNYFSPKADAEKNKKHFYLNFYKFNFEKNRIKRKLNVRFLG